MDNWIYESICKHYGINYKAVHVKKNGGLVSVRFELNDFFTISKMWSWGYVNQLIPGFLISKMEMMTTYSIRLSKLYK